MQSSSGLLFIEYIWPAHGPRPIVLDRFPFWPPEPDVAYLRGLAHAGLRCFYRSEHVSPEPVIVDGVTKQVVPEALRLIDGDGRELGRWTAADEYEELSFPHRGTGSVNRTNIH
ncbi:MAG TPA: hypothetical protein VME69_04350 [Methylocella sp.]|nr:hypothetical protein [Methylocella sp.]